MTTSQHNESGCVPVYFHSVHLLLGPQVNTNANPGGGI